MMPSLRAIILVLFAGLLVSCSAIQDVLAQDASQPESGALLPRPTSVYEGRTAAGVPVRLNYYGSPTGSSLVFMIGDIGKPLASIPSLEEQGQILDHLLGPFSAEHPVTAPTPLLLGVTKDGLVERLVEALRKPQANWDARHGRTLQGNGMAVLTSDLDAVLQASPIAKAFAAHGYALKLKAIGRVEMGNGAGKDGGRFPQFIDTMDIDVTKA